MWRASALLAGNVPAEGDLQLDEMGIPPAVPLPLGDVRLDIAGPPAIVAVRVEADKCPDVLNPLSVGDVNLPAPARRAEADGAGCRHLNPSSSVMHRSSPRRSVPTPRHVEAAAVAGRGRRINPPPPPQSSFPETPAQARALLLSPACIRLEGLRTAHSSRIHSPLRQQAPRDSWGRPPATCAAC